MWIRKLKQKKHNWKYTVLVTSFNDKPTSLGTKFVLSKEKGNLFWANVFNAYKLFYNRIEPNNSNDLLVMPVLINKRIKIGTGLSHVQIGLKKGVYNFASFLGNTGGLLTFSEFKNKYVFTLIV